VVPEAFFFSAFFLLGEKLIWMLLRLDLLPEGGKIPYASSAPY
jgi:hypothetical protein